MGELCSVILFLLYYYFMYTGYLFCFSATLMITFWQIILVTLRVVSYLYENNYTIVDVTVDVLS